MKNARSFLAVGRSGDGKCPCVFVSHQLSANCAFTVSLFLCSAGVYTSRTDQLGLFVGLFWAGLSIQAGTIRTFLSLCHSCSVHLALISSQSPRDCNHATYTCGCSKASRQPGQDPIFLLAFTRNSQKQPSLHGVTTRNAVPSFFMLLFERVQSLICPSSRTALSAGDIPGRESASWSSSEFVF